MSMHLDYIESIVYHKAHLQTSGSETTPMKEGRRNEHDLFASELCDFNFIRSGMHIYKIGMVTSRVN